MLRHSSLDQGRVVVVKDRWGGKMEMEIGARQGGPCLACKDEVSRGVDESNMSGECPPQLDTIGEKDTKKGRKGGEQKYTARERRTVVRRRVKRRDATVTLRRSGRPSTRVGINVTCQILNLTANKQLEYCNTAVKSIQWHFQPEMKIHAQ